MGSNAQDENNHTVQIENNSDDDGKPSLTTRDGWDFIGPIKEPLKSSDTCHLVRFWEVGMHTQFKKNIKKNCLIGIWSCCLHGQDNYLIQVLVCQ